MIGVNASLFEPDGFKDRFERHASDGVIADLELQLRQVYEDVDAGNANHLARIAVFTVV